MFRNYLAAALRNLARNRLYAGINIVGLAVGFAAAILIALFVRDEFSYDTWIPGYERTYLLTETLGISGRTPIESDTTPVELAEPLKLEFPGIEAAARATEPMVSDGTTMSMRHGEIESNETIFWADPEFFSVLPVPAIVGDLRTALNNPDSIVLSRKIARKYFGTDDPIGQTVEIDRQHPMKVTAIIEDLPSNTHLTTDIIASGRATFSFFSKRQAKPLAPGAWNSAGWTYIRLKPGYSAASIQAALPGFLDRHMKRAVDFFSSVSVQLTPLSEVHLRLENATASMKPADDPAITIALAIIGVMLVMVASINFINLMTARASRRAIEVGVRKVSGATRSILIVQFIGEAMIYAMLGMAIAAMLVELLLPTFNAFLDRQIAFDYWRDPMLIGGMSALTILTGVLAGFYPALVLSAFRPAYVLKGGANLVSGSGRVRQILVILQFAILIGLIVGTSVVYRQTSFALNEGMRVDRDQIVLIKTECKTGFSDRIRTLPGVRIAACSTQNGLIFGTSNTMVGRPNGTNVDVAIEPVDFDYLELYGLKPLAGRFFSRDHSADGKSFNLPENFPASVVINETALRKFGFSSAQEAVGQTVAFKGFDGPDAAPSEIIGVVPDFSLDSIYSLTSPTVYFVYPGGFRWLTVKLKGQDIPETLTAIGGLWKESGDAKPLQLLFLDRELQRIYLNIRRQGQLLAAFAGIAVFIACLGLFGLSAFTAERRTKEIGIRKAMGAGRLDIVRLLVWQFSKPVLLANLIAWPVGYYFMNRWLHGFAYHVDLSPWIFLAAGAAALVIALATVSAHAFLVAQAKPVTALRYE